MSPSSVRSPVVAAVGLVRCGGIVFAANAALLVLQLIAGRLLSPLIGVSLATWTAVIGIFLAGISLGNWWGGRLADRSPSPRRLNGALAAGGLAALLLLGLLHVPGVETAARAMPLGLRIVVLTLATCLPASFALSVITPLAIKLALPDLGRAGRVFGLLYALGTLGSLCGAFLTGLVLVAFWSLNTIGLGVACGLFLLACLPTRARRPQADTQEADAQEDARAPAPPAETSLLSGRLRRGLLVVGTASFCSMALEMSASRLLAPVVGVSLLTWTGILGVLLAAMSVGNLLGGQLADRRPRASTLGLCLFLAGLSILAIPVLFERLSKNDTLGAPGLVGQILSLVAALYFMSMLLLGTVTPQVTRLVLTDLKEAGRVAGGLYAGSCAAAIAGTFATGWLLIGWLGVNLLLGALGLILLVLAFLIGRFHRSLLWLPTGLAAVAACYGVCRGGYLRSPYTRETNYFAIKVQDIFHDGRAVRSLGLDHLTHSYVDLEDPSYLAYTHWHIQAELTRLLADETDKPQVLVIGGGGYCFPRWVEENLARVGVDVVEIDPGVTEVAYEELGLARDTHIRSFNLDGRQYVAERAAPGHYQLVIQDAVNDLSVPYHLVTKEYNDAVRRILAPNGFYLLTVIDCYKKGPFLKAAVRTMQETFPEVRLLASGADWDADYRGIYIICGSQRRLDLDHLRAVLSRHHVDQMYTQALDGGRLRADLARGPSYILTDQYAPVDHLMVSHFLEK